MISIDGKLHYAVKLRDESNISLISNDEAVENGQDKY